MATALRFIKYYGDTVDFDEDEYIYCKEIPRNNSMIQIPNNRFPNVYDRTNGTSLKNFEIQIFENTSATRDKVVSLFDRETDYGGGTIVGYAYWFMYPTYIADATYVIQYVIFDPIFISQYSFGRQKQVIHTIKAYEI